MRATDVERCGRLKIAKVLGCQELARCRCRGVKVKESANASHVGSVGICEAHGGPLILKRSAENHKMATYCEILQVFVSQGYRMTSADRTANGAR